MWITGFDVPSLSTLYLDKPMRNHTLMQTIARANRVFSNKVNGLIVDYAGVFRDLQKALAIYGSAGGNLQEGEMPVKDKSELIEALQESITETEAFCKEHGIDTAAILFASAKDFNRMSRIQDAVDALVVNDEVKKKYLSLVNRMALLYKAMLPDPAASTYSPIVALCVVIAREILSTIAKADISEVLDDIEKLMDSSVATKSYIIRESSGPYDTSAGIDLSQIDFDALQAYLNKPHKHIEIEKLRGAIDSKLQQMVQLNKSRSDYLERFQRLIDEYNAGSVNADILLEKLIAFTRELNVEDVRHIAEQLSEEELALFDLLTRPNMELTEKEKDQVKKVVRSLLETLKREKLVLDWRKKQQARANVQTTIKDILDELPRVYTKELYERKCAEAYSHIYDCYYGQGRSVYARAS